MLGKRSAPGDPLLSPEYLGKLPRSAADRLNPLTGIPFSQKYWRILEDRRHLPAFQIRQMLLDLLETDDVIVLQGETGSGKTTQVPQFLLNTKWSGPGKMLACTQPRRIAAISVAKRVAEETDTILSEQIGYCVRFDDSTTPKTRLKYMTDGMLIRELLGDPTLSKYSVIFIDEAHERTLNTDILLPILKQIVRSRSRLGQSSSNPTPTDSDKAGLSPTGPLKLIIMSATIQVERFIHYFDSKPPLLVVPGRTHPVEVFYSKNPEKDYVEATIRTAIQIHVCEPPGDILVFLTGEDEIEKAVTAISNKAGELEPECGPVVVYPLFGSMPIDQQQRVFERSLGVRKIIVSTNIAETSVTIDGIVYVVDSGFSKQKLYHPKYKFDSLKIAPISQASALQRAGRAGRTCPGKCFRLYTEASFNSELPAVTEPEIKRNELSNMILGLNTLGITQLTQFDFIEAPPTETIFRGLEILQQIGAISSPDGQLTKVGQALSRFPLEPRMGKVLLVGRSLGVGEECLNVVSVLTSGNWKVRPSDSSDKADQAHRQFSADQSCDLAAINAVLKSFISAPNQKQFCAENYVNFKVLSMSLNVKTQLKQMLFTTEFEGEPQSEFANLSVGQRLKIAFLAGYFQHVAHLQPNGTYAVLFNEPNCVLVHPASVVKAKPEFLMYIEYILTIKDYIRTVSEINLDWLLDLYPEMFRSTSLALMTEHSRKRVQSAMAGKSGTQASEK